MIGYTLKYNFSISVLFQIVVSSGLDLVAPRVDSSIPNVFRPILSDDYPPNVYI